MYTKTLRYNVLLNSAVFLHIFLLIQPFALPAQDFNIPVFRGELVQKYNYTLEGTVYAYSDEFQPGSIHFNGKQYSGLMMNLNAHRNELQVRIGTTGESIAVKRSLVGDFTIGKRNFTALYGERGIKGLAEGYYQVLYKGEGLLLKKIYKNVSEQANFITGAITKVFTTKYRYYLVKEGMVYKIKDEKSLIKHYKEHKGKTRAFIKERKGRMAATDDIMQGVMKIMEE